MAQIIVSWFICDGRFRVHAINAVGRCPRRLIEIEEIDTRERIHGCDRKLERVVRMLRSNYGDEGHVATKGHPGVQIQTTFGCDE
jgi:hypothetical protein